MFVDYVPEAIEEGMIYVSLEFATAIHKCACGCGYEIVTPLSPNDWKLTFDGEAISLYPSIGNWRLPCRSHYWLTNNRAIETKSRDEPQNKKNKWRLFGKRNLKHKYKRK